MKILMIPAICLFNYVVETSPTKTYPDGGLLHTHTYAPGFITDILTDENGFTTYEVDFSWTIEQVGLNPEYNHTIKYGLNKWDCRILK